jgi:DNA-binding MarR family transcriptional regulator
LVDGGYIDLKPDPTDGRVKHVILAKKGVALMVRLNKALDQSTSKK